MLQYCSTYISRTEIDPDVSHVAKYEGHSEIIDTPHWRFGHWTRLKNSAHSKSEEGRLKW